MSIGWQLVQGIAALLVSVTLSYWIFVAPSAARRQARQIARELQDPRQP
jgi:hypothetical protein